MLKQDEMELNLYRTHMLRVHVTKPKTSTTNFEILFNKVQFLNSSCIILQHLLQCVNCINLLTMFYCLFITPTS